MFISLYLRSDWLRSTGNFVVNHLPTWITIKYGRHELFLKSLNLLLLKLGFICIWKQIVVFRNGHTRTIPFLFGVWLTITKCCWGGEYSHTLFVNDTIDKLQVIVRAFVCANFIKYLSFFINFLSLIDIRRNYSINTNGL
jgi:hypothetical protein